MPKTLRTILFLMLIVAAVINYADRQIIAVLKPMIQHQLGWTDGDYGALVSVFQFAAAFGLLGAGWFIDRVGLKLANPLGVFAWSVSAIGHTVARTLAEFSVARIALGASEATGTPSAIKAVASWYRPEERSAVLGIMLAATSAGAIVTPLFIPPLALAVGWRMSFVVVGVAGLIWVAVWLLLTARVDMRGPAEDRALEGHRVPWSVVLGDRNTWAIAGAKVFCDLTWWVMLFWAPDLFVRVFHLTLANIGAPLAVVYACAAAGAFIGGQIPGPFLSRGVSIDRVRKTILLVAGLAVLPMPAIILVQNYWLAVAALGWVLFWHQVYSTNLFATTTDIIPASRVATVTSIGAFSGNLAGMAILAVAGIILARFNSYLPLLLLIAPAYLLSLGWLHLLAPRLQRPAEEAIGAPVAA